MHIICLGDLCCDLIVPYGKMQKILASPDLSGEKAGMMNVSMQCGGSVANVARTLGKLGDRPIMVTPVGGDDLGQYLRSEMEKAGVDMDYAVPSAKSNNYCVAVLDGRGERTMFCFVPPWADFPRFSERSFEGIPDADILFTSGMAILDDEENDQAVLSFVRRQKERGARIVFDLNVRAESYGYVGVRKEACEEMLSLSDIVLLSGEEEFLPVTGFREQEKAARTIWEMTEEGTVIARNGHLPILVLGKGELSEGITIPIKPLKVLSTLGAGDSFDGAFLHEIAQGEGAADAARKASDYAGLFISGKL